MPLREFTCTNCDNTFEELVSPNSDGPGVTCPRCGSDQLEKLVSRFASTAPSPGCGRGGESGGSCGPGSGRFT